MNEESLNILRQCRPWHSAYEIQRHAVGRFHELCADVLGTACPLRPPKVRDRSMERNLFSTLFIMMTASLGLSDEKVRFYAMVNQCLRALVTGCDNILDDEYKEVIPFNVPGDGIRFRSVLTVMTGDAVIARVAAAERAAGRLDAAKADGLPRTVLSVLIPSGLEEHEEESLLDKSVPTPEAMLNSVHFRKTGLLFQAPLRLVERMGDASPEDTARLTRGLTQFAAGCQILDDMKDAGDDLWRRRHNLVVSAAYHGDVDAERHAVVEALRAGGPHVAHAGRTVAALTEAMNECASLAGSCFADAYRSLSNAVPEFGMAEAAALGHIIQASIVNERNDALEKEAG